MKKDMNEQPLAFFGDVHGDFDKLKVLVTKLREKYGNDMGIVGLGDICDRGPNVRDCFQFLIDENIVSMKGNHEQWMLGFAKGQDFKRLEDVFGNWTYRSNGGQATLRSYGVDETTIRFEQVLEAKYQFQANIPLEHIKYLDSMPLILDTPYGYAVHAGALNLEVLQNVPEGISLMDHWEIWGVDSLVWSCPNGAKERCSSDMWHTFDKPQICGHIIRTSHVDVGNYIGIDTGCGAMGKYGKLTAVVFPEKKFISV